MSRTPHRRLALLPLGCFLAHALARCLAGHWEDALWNCTVANLLLALGLAWPAPRLVAAASMWLLLGTPYWLYYLWLGGELHPTSALTHLVGPVVSAIGVARLGLPSGSWALATALLAALTLLCRAVTPPEANVNLSHGPHSEWLRSALPGFWAHFAFMVLAQSAAWIAVEWLVRRRWKGEPG